MPGLLERVRASLAGRYTIERELGRGGMATVYQACDLKHQRTVAIKLLRPELFDAHGRARFLREIEIAAVLQHPNILPLHDSGGADGLLYYVMPYVEGESLRDRIAREKHLPVTEALQIAREVADALAYAHRSGIVHRDVKPGNILLSGGHALVADFGIARAISAAGGAQLTERGIALGTPAYMSPEQASGQDAVDARSDVYSLGCVVYEMLAGEPPFTGRTAQAIMARQMQERPPSLRVVRPTVSLALQEVIEQALAKVPADRFATASEFAAALAAAPGRGPPARRRVAALAAFAAAAAMALFLLLRSAVWVGPSRESGLVDTLRYAILPFERTAGVATFDESRMLEDALTRWSGITVVDRFQAREAIARRGIGPLSSGDARAVALELRAGRYIRGDVTPIGDSIRVHAALYDASLTSGVLSDATVKLSPALTDVEGAFAALVEQLLFGNAPQERPLMAHFGTRSFPARQAHIRGVAAVRLWDLASADSAFAAATQYDPEYAEAHLWLAQVRFWSDNLVATWRSSAERAAAARGRLSSRDQALSDALLALGRGETERACGMWDRLTRKEPYDFAAWYGLAKCLGEDKAVVRDGATASGWRFRSSHYQATKAYERAFELLPSIHKGLTEGSYESARRLLLTQYSAVQFGRAVPPDTTTFVAYPSWQGDTLSFVPYPIRRFKGPEVVPAGMRLAVHHERELFHDIATAWVAAFPQSPDAVEALAISLGLLEDPAALDTLRRARSLATTAEQRTRLGGDEVWMRVKFSVPSDLAGVHAARALADSLLHGGRSPNGLEPLVLLSLAALTGRAGLAAGLSRHPAVLADWDVPGPLTNTAGPLRVFAALGGPLDSLGELEQRTDAVIDRRFVMPLQQQARMDWLSRPAALAFPSYRFRSLEKLVGGGNYLLDAEAALLRGDTAVIRRTFTDLEAARRSTPAAITLDALYPETWLLAQQGDVRRAIEWLDPTLTALPASDPETFLDPANAGALVQAIALRAELAERVGDQVNARRWAAVVTTLWSDADPFLEPVVRRMRRLGG